jgi:NADPH-dependent 2,4-dienoyl-CoA reductase/sulfur reductase-like enzyme/rhodanese-related sulfurtransferase
VTSIDRGKKMITAVQLSTGEVYTEPYDKLVLSPGAEPIRPPLPGISGEGIFTLRNVHDTDIIKRYVQQSGVNKVVIIGAGFIGLEMAENFHNLGLHVTIVEMINQVLAPVDFPIAALVQQHIRSKGVQLRLNTTVTGFIRDVDGLSVTFKNGEILKTDMVLLSIGVRPDTKLAEKAGLKIGSARGIEVNEYLQTSDPDIYAVGDAIEFKNFITGRPVITYLAGPANKQGRICANNMVLGNSHPYRGSINTAIVKVFEMTIAATGMPAKNLKAANIPHIVSTNHAGSHASYYPEAKRMCIQIAFSPGDGRLLGAQIAGYEGVDKRIDILSSYIKLGRTIYDLEEFEQAYAPPYSSAKDPVNMAGFIAENILMKRLRVFYWDELAGLKPDDLLIDVRRADEFAAGNIPGAINIPVDEIRERLQEIPAGKQTYIYCEAGLRGYLAQRILKQNGYDSVVNLSGGYILWKACAGETELQKTNYEYEFSH